MRSRQGYGYFDMADADKYLGGSNVLWTIVLLSDILQDFAKLAKPLHNLTRKNAVFVWNQACEAAFQALKERLRAVVDNARRDTHRTSGR